MAVAGQLSTALSDPPSRTEYRFDFGGRAAAGYKRVAANSVYNQDDGYGFEPGSSVREVNRGGKDAFRDGFVTSDKPFFFSAEVPEGNYKVTAIFGDREGTSETTVKAELRRLMVEHARTQPGKFETGSFIVNVRNPEIPGGKIVKFKERERTSEAWAWDNKLTLEFSNRQPKLCALRIERVDVPTIYIAGDSTSTDQAKEPYNSWGQMLPRFFKPDIAVANNGESGETARSFAGENRWAKIMGVIKPGDYVFIQFGHNDQKERDGGAFTTYKARLKSFIVDAKDHGASPVLITPMNRRTFDSEGKVTNSLGDFPDAVRQLATEEHVPLIDLNALSKVLYEALGPETSGRLFAGDDHTHHSDYGSYELAKCIVRGIKAADLPIAKDLVTDVPDFDPAHPDPYEKFKIPPDPDFTIVKPYGQ